MDRSTVITWIGAAGLVVAVAACGGPSTTSTPQSLPAPGPSTQNASPTPIAPTTKAPSPAATEDNPPGDIPDNQVFVVYKGGSGSYSVEVPEGWARTSVPSGVSFTDKLNSVTVVHSGRTTAPTEASVIASDVEALAAQVPQFHLDAVKTFTRPGGSGVLVTYHGDSAPDPVTDKVVRDASETYIFYKNGQQVALTLTGPENADNVDPWARVSGSFRWAA